MVISGTRKQRDIFRTEHKHVINNVNINKSDVLQRGNGNQNKMKFTLSS